MMSKIPVRSLGLCYLAFVLVGTLVNPADGQNLNGATIAQTQESNDPSEPNNLRPLSQSESVLSIEGAQRLMGQAEEAINKENYALAADRLQQARRIFNQLSNYHLKLASLFQGINPQIVESQRASALQTGQLRDEATYKLALVHRAQSQPELAVPLLIQVIESQNPSSELGKKSYQQLYELGFVNTPMSPPNNPSASN